MKTRLVASLPQKTSAHRIAFHVFLTLMIGGVRLDATDYLFNLTTGTGTWSTTTIWTPNGTPGSGDNIDATSIDSGGATLSLGGTTRTINNLTKTVANRWNISGAAATQSTLNVNNITIGTSNMVFFDGNGGGGLVVNATNVTVTAGTLFFGATSLSASNLMRGLAVSGTTTVSGGALQMNVSNTSSNSYSLGLLTVSGTGAVSVNNAPTTKAAATANVTGLNGSGGFIQDSPTTGQAGNVGILAITNTTDYSSGTVLRDSVATTDGTTLRVSKAGTGTQTLSGTNTYTGATAITNGVLKLGNAAALGGRSGIVASNTDNGTNVSGTGTLDLGGQTGVTEVIRLNGTGFGGNGALINSGAAASIGSGVAAILQTSAGTGALPTLTISGGGGTGATATVISQGLTSSSFTINGGTTVYSAAPTVTITGGGSPTTTATATAILTGGVVTGITITNAGAGYTTAPTIAFSGGTVTTSGTAPSGTGNATNFTPVSYSITNAGSGFTSAPSIAYSTGTTTATAVLSGIVLVGNSSIGGSGDITVNGVVSESGGSRVLTKVGTNVLTLANAGNSYSGGTIINAGTVSIGADAALGTVPGAATPALLTLNGGTLATTASFTLNANRGISLGASGGTVNVATSTSLSYGGVIADSGALTKAGAGTLTLAGVNTYSGGTQITGGTLSIAADAALGTVPGAATAAQLTLNGGTLGTTADMTLHANRGVALGASGGSIDVATGTTLSYGGSIAGAGALTKTGTGTLALSGSSSYTGATTLSAGTLVISNGSALGTTAGGVTVSAGTLQLSGGITVGAEALSLTGDGATAALGALLSTGGDNTWGGNVTVTSATRINSDSGSLLLSGNVSANGSGNFTVGGAGNVEISGVLSGSGMTLFKASVGAGDLILSNAGNTFAGSTTIANGMVVISTESNLGVASSFVASKLRLRGGALRTTADVSLGVNRGVTLSNGGGGFSPDAGTTLTVNSVVTGTSADALSKNGEGTLVFTAANTYAGTTTVNAGTLMVTNATGSGTGSGAVNVISGTLAGNHTGAGNIAGAVVIGSGSVLSPGGDASQAMYGVGTLQFTSLDLQTGSISRLNIEGTGSYDRFTVSTSGGLTLNGRISISTGLSGSAFDTAFAEGSIYDLIDWAGLLGGSFDTGSDLRDGSGDDASQFDLPDLSSLGRRWDVSSFLSNGTIMVVGVPEPSRVLLLGCAIAALQMRRRRSKSHCGFGF